MALIKMFREAWAFIFGGTVEDLAGDVRSAKRAAGKTADVGGQALVGVGAGLDVGLKATHGAASVVGRILGALLPSAPVGPGDVADAAVAADDASRRRAYASAKASIEAMLPVTDPAAVAALALETAALFAARGQDAASKVMTTRLPSDVSVWLLGLDDAQLRAVMAAGVDGIQHHLAGTRPIAGVPAVGALGSAAAPALVINDNELKERALAARRSLAASRYDAEAASRRGTRHRVDETFPEEEPAPASYPRRRVGRGYY
ncbi:hypothetical protein [Methylobacterium aquaticum]|uniref:hypothetical protein n=1 Tax=Methylobacterium aquaticum TaxID=270351 RepID=UPI0019316FF4|nr:hypothetical protein [Methylobacterium aquaticum]QRE76841.1 hypothetical protein F1D61_27760 [Methylobacterium aquaticum]